MKRFTYRLALMLLISITIISCAGIKYQDQPLSANTLDSHRSKARTTVLAQAEEWRNSGIIVERGKRFSINAKGRWSAGGTCNWTGPDGIGANNILCPDVGTIVKGWSQSALIGKIGEDGMNFGIGNELDLNPKDTGTLYLRINDTPGFCGDNSGYVDVDVVFMGTDGQQPGESKINVPAVHAD